MKGIWRMEGNRQPFADDPLEKRQERLLRLEQERIVVERNLADAERASRRASSRQSSAGLARKPSYISGTEQYVHRKGQPSVSFMTATLPISGS